MTSEPTEKTPAANTGLAKVAVQCSADTFVVKSPPIANLQTFIGDFNDDTTTNKQTK